MPEILSPEQALHLLDTCPIPMLVVDNDGMIFTCNHAFAKMLEKPGVAELTGRPVSSLSVLSGAGKLVSYTNTDGQVRNYKVRRGSTGGDDPLEVRYYIDITRQLALEQSQHALREELREHTLTDSATGLLNQRGLMLALEPQVARSRRYNSPISIVTLDVCSNDGEDALRKQIALQLKDQLRWADLIGCDDEHAFVLVLPETGQDAALQLAEKLHGQLVAAAQRDFPEQNVSAFYGVTGWRRTDNAVTLLNRANLALERARAEQNHQPVAL